MSERFHMLILLMLFLITVPSCAWPDDGQSNNDTFLSDIFVRAAASGDFPHDHRLLRKGGYEAGLGYTVFKTNDGSGHQLKLSVEASYLDFGQQPNGIRNINRVINIDAGADLQIWRRFSGFVLAGVTDSDFGHNGDLPSEAGYGYKAHNGFSGYNAAVGLSYQAIKNLFVYVEKGVYHFHQIDRTDSDPRGHTEDNGDLTLGLKVDL